MRTEQWVKKLAGTAGEHYVAAELSKRRIPNALLPENFSGDDIIFGKKDGETFGYIQVKSCHPDRGNNFPLDEKHENWASAKDNQFVIFVWLGSTKNNEAPIYWIARKRDVGLIIKHTPPNRNPVNTERRFIPDEESGLVPKSTFIRLKKDWRIYGWDLFKEYLP